MDEVTELAQQIFDGIKHPKLLLGHAVDGDAKWLERLNVFTEFERVIDIGWVYAGLHDLHHLSRLGVMLDRYGIEHSCLHNAGNDAKYTLDLALAIIGTL